MLQTFILLIYVPLSRQVLSVTVCFYRNLRFSHVLFFLTQCALILVI
jgi:hypothetical protein